MPDPSDRQHPHSDSQTELDRQAALSAAKAKLEALLWQVARVHDEGGVAALAEATSALLELDAQGQAAAQCCLGGFLGLGLDAVAERQVLCALMRRYWSELLGGYGVLLKARSADFATVSRDVLPQLLVRTMCAAINCAKWDGFGHGPLGEAIWGQLNAAYRLACRHGVNELLVSRAGETDRMTSAEREYRRAMAFHSLGLDQFNAWRLELASIILDRVLDHMSLVSELDASCLSWIDTALSVPPGRLVHTPLHAALPRYLRGPGVSAALAALRRQVDAGQVDEGLCLVHDPARQQLATVLAHIVRLWSNALPMRKHRRHVMLGRLQVVGGMHRLVGCLAEGGAAHHARDWSVHDVSLHGLGMDALDSDLEQIEVGSLLGVQAPEGNRWRIGTVRRLWHSRGGRGQIGVELLGESPVYAEADDGERRVRVLLLDPLLRGMKVRMVLPLMDGLRESPLYVFDQHRPVRLTPLPGREFGVDYEIRSYQMALN